MHCYHASCTFILTCVINVYNISIILHTQKMTQIDFFPRCERTSVLRATLLVLGMTSSPSLRNQGSRLAGSSEVRGTITTWGEGGTWAYEWFVCVSSSFQAKFFRLSLGCQLFCCFHIWEHKWIPRPSTGTSHLTQGIRSCRNRVM